MKGMRTVKMEELPPEVIEAARRRRQREVEKDQLPDLDSIELPDNHPFAVKKKLAPEEERLQRSRFSARRGLSEEDMRRLREQQALADQMDAEEEARQAAARRRS
ncbi:aspartyl glutamyl-tRNA amidotransferase subunit B [Micractinium conductrix]|uniref:Aspartyl glutamyl-tRNA amidotransferase subunit B n=1 Tax=Micractinium conductrix TaxID=554055 RepID=A0A2P6V6X5_9CHLO|nr:aspartyl glutamyl-tRNA amidotransferase subunit B [Micractinium conductrix]|eukprot:PSC69843.1 aspartyl glutamyl-tRNA amidotransferase subunit B [Micractinium conductrix]